MANRVRYILLCEDKMQERFFRKVLAQSGLKEIRSIVAPSGLGSAARFVARKFPIEVKALRAKSFQKNLGLLAAIDGDRYGVGPRCEELEKTLAEGGLEKRRKGERIAIEAPTWSIETWIGHLSGKQGLSETESYKHASWLRERREKTQRIKDAAERFSILLSQEDWTAEFPSLTEGLSELERLRG